MKIQIAFFPFHHHNPVVKKDTENQIRSLISSGSAPASAGLKSDLSAIGLSFEEQDGSLSLTDNIELLDRHKILERSLHEVSLDIQWSIGSTNDYLMKSDTRHESIAVCMAEQQVAGKGRRGKVWVSPFGKNIYMSLGKHFTRSASGLMGLSLVIGSCVVQTLRELGVSSVGLKWPNDILLEGGKLAGILVELGSARKGSVYVVMGVGINLDLDEDNARQIEQPWSVVGRHAEVTRNDLAARLIDSLVPALTIFEKEGFESFREEWNSNNVYKDREVVILQGENRIRGVDAGVDSDGNYLLDTGKGIRTFNAGEVSLRLGDS
ncbi:MAG: biotin--[acetyl-CoA-carboxylase] ligase [Candidatus Marinimicrobia bacterium]|jgi:BirA family transcriptional regulator, biotin operon repressor / biotin---[acetyl-CoA-carboxylase] ligase|nr:biotin--[acetyl-CoA-carboxylase] ligase [Candidatus Neomarinimicrobiota bacterium]